MDDAERRKEANERIAQLERGLRNWAVILCLLLAGCYDPKEAEKKAAWHEAHETSQAALVACAEENEDQVKSS